eukprot:gnl/TRDRNA2_/TRDRNA2_161636_c0_seq2.p1 gnl/TRDRNA2_/TRDRNA2_161636_c0~~gnl/TRDRNA2_/TRDRNA2_161636_c0_seq2.p1  ORF type:complete len:349 (+),score=79.18 gnl/TRDRNA2_/TRDRNA2_161636_c0_seq2:28-1047(+)
MPPRRKIIVPEELINDFDRPLHRLAMFPGYTTLAAPMPAKEPVRRRATIGSSASTPSLRFGSDSIQLSPPKRSDSKRSASKGSTSSSTIASLMDKVAKPRSQKVDIAACQLAAKHHLTLYEVKKIKKGFENDDGGGLNESEFHSVLCTIFKVKKVDDKVLHEAYEASRQKDTGAQLEKFLQWYIQHMFSEVSDLTADALRSASEKLVMSLAQQHQVSPLVIDKIKKQFDHYDADGSGEIDYDEFQDMFCDIVKCHDKSDLNQAQIRKFWREVDKDGSGGVDFAEFVAWYLRYFDPDSEEVNSFNTHGTSPMEHFYDNFNPTVQRRNSMMQMMRHFSTED